MRYKKPATNRAKKMRLKKLAKFIRRRGNSRLGINQVEPYSNYSGVITDIPGSCCLMVGAKLDSKISKFRLKSGEYLSPYLFASEYLGLDIVEAYNLFDPYAAWNTAAKAADVLERIADGMPVPHSSGAVL